MFLLKYISLPVFLISFALGLFFVYIFGTDRKIIYVYPTPDNIEKVLFRDATDQCFKYAAEKVPCPENPGDIQSVPMQDVPRGEEVH